MDINNIEDPFKVFVDFSDKDAESLKSEFRELVYSKLQSRFERGSIVTPKNIDTMKEIVLEAASELGILVDAGIYNRD